MSDGPGLIRNISPVCKQGSWKQEAMELGAIHGEKELNSCAQDLWKLWVGGFDLEI